MSIQNSTENAQNIQNIQSEVQIIIFVFTYQWQEGKATLHLDLIEYFNNCLKLRQV